MLCQSLVLLGLIGSTTVASLPARTTTSLKPDLWCSSSTLDSYDMH